MPEISRFFGIVIRMYFNDHQPPHFHAEYGNHEGIFNIVDLNMLEGNLPRRVKALVLEWAFENRFRLMQNWEQMQKSEAPQKILPLE
ncbi:MAG: DUF4160 domain-containing protein [Cyanothece sp. SIO1E1]|nr:DUF4160 domain-containing protein [Cyanothece sp. SIO1E1]